MLCLFLRSTYLQPASFVDVFRTSTLRYQLKSGLCTEGNVYQMRNSLALICGGYSGADGDAGQRRELEAGSSVALYRV